MKAREVPRERTTVQYLVYAYRYCGASFSKSAEVRQYANDGRIWIQLPHAELRLATEAEAERYAIGFDDWQGVYA